MLVPSTTWVPSMCTGSIGPRSALSAHPTGARGMAVGRRSRRSGNTLAVRRALARSGAVRAHLSLRHDCSIPTA